jgi:hypothetical protein
MISLGLGLWPTTILSRLGFSPSALFANGEPGAWFDDFLETTFTDTAGTTPATVGSAVALMLDKSKGLVLGPELVAPLDLTSADWGTLGAVSSVTPQTITTTGVGGRNSTSLLTNKNYQFEITFSKTTSTTFSIVFDGQTLASSTATTGTLTCIGRGSVVNPSFYLRLGGADTVTIESISVRELPGFHATQSVTAARPILARVPARGRVNLLTRTEEFDNAAWVTGPSGTATVTKSTTNAAAAPDGTMTADRVLFSLNGGTTTGDIALLRQAATAPAGSATHSVYLRSFDGVSSYVMQIIAADGTAQNITVTGEWQRFSVTAPAAGTPLNYGVRLRGGLSPANSDSADILLWGAQLEEGSTASAYQKVTSTYDVTEAGQADNYFLWFDGIDDSMVTPTITPGIDKVQVFAGVRKLSDAAGAVLVELSATLANNGSFNLQAPRASSEASYRFASRGTATSEVVPLGYSAPVTNILTGLGDISGDQAVLRIDGTQAGQSTTDQGTGNFLAYPMYIGSRGGTTLYFNGHLYSLITRFGANLDANTLTQTETYVAGKTAGVELT